MSLQMNYTNGKSKRLLSFAAAYYPKQCQLTNKVKKTNKSFALLLSSSSKRGVHSSSSAPLHYEWIQYDKSKSNNVLSSSSSSSIVSKESNNNHHVMIFLHGLLGNIKNIKTMATKICQLMNRNGLLIDLPGHGQTYKQQFKQQQDQSNNNTVISLESTVHDINTTIQHAIIEFRNNKIQSGDPNQKQTLYNNNSNSTNNDRITIVGHSLGGRIALQYAVMMKQRQQLLLTHQLDSIWLLDTVPGNVDSSVYHVLQSAKQVQQQLILYNEENNSNTNNNNKNYKKLMLHLLLNEPYNFNEMLAQWLISSYNNNTKQFNFDLLTANQYVDSIQQQDLIKNIRYVLSKSDNNDREDNENTTMIHLIQGGKNNAWKQSNVQTSIQSLVNDYPNNSFTMYTLPNAGHWVHIDDLPGLLDIFRSSYSSNTNTTTSSLP